MGSLAFYSITLSFSRLDGCSKVSARSVNAKYRPSTNRQSATSSDEKVADDNAPQPTYWDEDTRGITVGKLAIPSMGIKLPIIKGIGQTNGYDNMLKAAVTNKQGQTMGKRNYVLSSHDIAQENVLFSPLSQTKVGAAIYLTDTMQVYTYRVIRRKTVKANQVAILDDVRQKRLVTLYTCDPDGEIVNGQTYERTVVVGELVKTSQASAKTLARF